jgi:hypothetical protein
MAADGTDTSPQSADSPLSGNDTAVGRADLGPVRDEGTPATDASAPKPEHLAAPESPGPDLLASALARDEGHALTNETGPSAPSEVTHSADQLRSAPGTAVGNTTDRGAAQADGTMSLLDRAKHTVFAGIAAVSIGTRDVAPPMDVLAPAAVHAAHVAENVGDTVDQIKKVADDISGGANSDLSLPGTGGGAAEHPATASTPEISVDKAPDAAGPDEPGSSVSDDIRTELQIRGEEEEDTRKAEAEHAALERRPPDRFSRAQSSPKKSDQVSDRRPTPTGRGQSRGRPK